MSLFKQNNEIVLFDEQLQVFAECSTFLINNMHKGSNLSKTPVKRLKARAGTGKTHTTNVMTKIINDAVPVPVASVALTGRAAAQLSRSGVETSTIHSLLYSPIIDDEGNLKHWNRNNPHAIRAEYSAIRVDESSMVPPDIMIDLMDIGLPLLMIGDDAQLPSISKTSFNIMDDEDHSDILTHPDSVLLTNRRTDERFVGIRWCMDRLLESGTLPRFGKKAGLNFVKKSAVYSGEIFETESYDIVLCGTNSTRKRINNLIRKKRGYTELRPEVGETIICLENNYLNNQKINNGELYKVDGRIDSEDFANYMLTNIETNEKYTIKIYDSSFDSETPPKRSPTNPRGHFTYGYCISTHKSQGSTFNNVLFVDEDVSFFLDRCRFRYTAVSRAAEKLTIAM